ncbi:MAG: hypothetical protein UY50_C0029G0018 [Parcubacteria group bacterium GW2011_GWA2_49_9]|nr:MAG: hypothetical protein UY50_C0029G0018 [Parcubacteria group bacterium GW2011_GWA2_49_9]
MKKPKTLQIPSPLFATLIAFLVNTHNGEKPKTREKLIKKLLTRETRNDVMEIRLRPNEQRLKISLAEVFVRIGKACVQMGETAKSL